MYANMVVNVVYVSLCYRTHGEGEGPTVSSPTEAAGRRQDPMGHLPFWHEYIMGMNTKSYENLFENQMQCSLWDCTSLSLEAIGKTPKEG